MDSASQTEGYSTGVADIDLILSKVEMSNRSNPFPEDELMTMHQKLVQLEKAGREELL